MKPFFLFIVIAVCTVATHAQTYPDPEFSNEVYLLKKGTPSSFVRLEKSYSKQKTKTKLGGFGGVEYAYNIDGEKSNLRLDSGRNISFVFSTGPSSRSDSMLKANGMDPQTFSSMGFDPSRMITLYKASSEKNLRKIYLAKSSGAFSMGNKNTSSDQYSFSIKKIREGYWELVPDKQLPSGEYAFMMMGFNTDGSYTVFAFGID